MISYVILTASFPWKFVGDLCGVAESFRKFVRVNLLQFLQ